MEIIPLTFSSAVASSLCFFLFFKNVNYHLNSSPATSLSLVIFSSPWHFTCYRLTLTPITLFNYILLGFVHEWRSSENWIFKHSLSILNKMFHLDCHKALKSFWGPSQITSRFLFKDPVTSQTKKISLWNFCLT